MSETTVGVAEERWGRRAPEGTVGPAWGARAIFEARKVDILHNRQSCVGGTVGERKALQSWLNKHGLKALRALVRTRYVDPRGHEVLRVESSGYVLEACANASGGYFYLGAWKVA